MPRILAILAVHIVSVGLACAQCNSCVADPTCTSSDGFPTLCPESLPVAEAGLDYETVITFFLPAEITDPGSGLVATLNSVTVTNISGIPPGMEIELDDPDGVYTPVSGQNSGCATLCGAPTFPGAFEIQISILAVITALGFEQDVTESFALPLLIEAGAGGTSSFSFTPSAGCGSVSAAFEATVFGEGNQITQHNWDFGMAGAMEGAVVGDVLFDTVGNQVVTLETTILDQVLDQVQLFSTGGGGWDDFFGNPDPYFTLKDGNENVVYTSGTVDDAGSASWDGLGVVLNNPPYSIDFYDEDLFDGDDWLGWAPFSPNGAGTINVDANPSNAQLTIGLNPVVLVLDSAEVTVHPFPEVDVVQLNGATLGCSNDSLFQYEWWLGDSLVASGAAAEFEPDASGWYAVSGLDANGCSALSDSVLFCMPEAMIPLVLNEVNGFPMALETQTGLEWWLWSFNGNSSDTVFVEGSIWLPFESGWYSVTSETALGCPVASDSLLVCWPLTPPEVIQDSFGNLVVDGSSWVAYEWWTDGAPLEGAVDAYLSNPGEGEYTVWVTDFEGCPSVQSDPVTFVGLEEVMAQAHWHVWPNPFLQGIECQVESRWLGGEALLRDASGRIVARHAILGNRNHWDLIELPSGPYLLHLTDVHGGVSSVQRLLKN
ncbi:MAG: hypothetical protein L7S67_03560 [Flavobacteriales bacterium]|nr:hypothetical protein [Flavobacteriales bacterium]